jgi:hypothetical protein
MFNKNETLAAADMSVSVGKEYAPISNVAVGICDGCHYKVHRCGGRLPPMMKVGMNSSENCGGRACAPAASRQRVFQLLKSGFVQHKYINIRADCLNERTALGPEHSPGLKMLYAFWTRFLVTNFNNPMYADFKKLAIEDYRVQCCFGIERLLEFYSSSLEKKLRPLLLADFHELALFTHSNGHQWGKEALLAFLRNRKDPMSLALLDGIGKLPSQTVPGAGEATSMMMDCQAPEISLPRDAGTGKLTSIHATRKRQRAERSPMPLLQRQPRRFRWHGDGSEASQPAGAGFLHEMCMEASLVYV